MVGMLYTPTELRNSQKLVSEEMSWKGKESISVSCCLEVGSGCLLADRRLADRQSILMLPLLHLYQKPKELTHKQAWFDSVTYDRQIAQYLCTY